MNKAVTVYGAIAISILVMLIFAGCLVVAYITHDAASRSLLVGSAATMAATVVGFWVGSSSGSQKKDDRPAPDAIMVPAPATAAQQQHDPAG